MELTEETAEVQILLVYKYVILGIASASARSANLRAQEKVSYFHVGFCLFSGRRLKLECTLMKKVLSYTEPQLTNSRISWVLPVGS